METVKTMIRPSESYKTQHVRKQSHHFMMSPTTNDSLNICYFGIIIHVSTSCVYIIYICYDRAKVLVLYVTGFCDA